MVRPRQCRHVSGNPKSTRFKPAGIPARELEETVLTIDEFEAVRLADHVGLYQEEAAAKMGVSRQTFGRIIEGARKKIARVLVNGTCLTIEGGNVIEEKRRLFRCKSCDHQWEAAHGRPEQCPRCQAKGIHRKQ